MLTTMAVKRIIFFFFLNLLFHIVNSFFSQSIHTISWLTWHPSIATNIQQYLLTCMCTLCRDRSLLSPPWGQDGCDSRVLGGVFQGFAYPSTVTPSRCVIWRKKKSKISWTERCCKGKRVKGIHRIAWLDLAIDWFGAKWKTGVGVEGGQGRRGQQWSLLEGSSLE